MKRPVTSLLLFIAWVVFSAFSPPKLIWDAVSTVVLIGLVVNTWFILEGK